jgi:hypothetical protein
MRGLIAFGLATGFGLTLLGVGVGPRIAGAVNGVASGVWWRAQSNGGTLPAPPTVPANGLWVSSDPSGDQSISAVRFTLDANEVAPKLKLTVARVVGPPNTQLVVACPASSAWQPTGAKPGEWSGRPHADCTKERAVGQLSPDSTTMTFDLTPLAAASAGTSTGKIDLVLAPAPSTTVPPTFDATFQPVTPTSVLVTNSPPTSGTGGVEPAGLPAPAIGTAGTATVQPTAVPSGISPSLAVGPVSAAPVTPPALATGAQPAAASTPTSPGISTARRILKGGRFSTGVRILAGVMLTLLCVWAMWVNAVRTGAVARLLVPATATSNKRTGAPPPLR